jgi:hypothetical protein
MTSLTYQGGFTDMLYDFPGYRSTNSRELLYLKYDACTKDKSEFEIKITRKIAQRKCSIHSGKSHKP